MPKRFGPNSFRPWLYGHIVIKLSRPKWSEPSASVEKTISLAEPISDVTAVDVVRKSSWKNWENWNFSWKWEVRNFLIKLESSERRWKNWNFHVEQLYDLNENISTSLFPTMFTTFQPFWAIKKVLSSFYFFPTSPFSQLHPPTSC